MAAFQSEPPPTALQVPVLTGTQVRLRPMSAADVEALTAAAAPMEDSFRWIPQPVLSAAAMEQWVKTALDARDDGGALPFTIERRDDGRVLGSTRLAALALSDRRAEIGWTWLTPTARRTAVNTECKRLLFGYAFDVLQLNRVELKTDSLNSVSRAAILRIGAQQEGIFRNHMVTASGRLRHSVWFSVVRDEWPDLRARLDARLAAGQSAAAHLTDPSGTSA